MSDFLTKIKRIKTDRLIYCFSKISIEMFHSNQCTKGFEVETLRYGLPLKGCVGLNAWDIQDIEFLSVKNSNDHRDMKEAVPIWELVNLYRKYDNRHSAAEALEKADLDGVFRILLGMSAEQFQFQNMAWIFEKFNRDYYILLAANGFMHRSTLDVDAVVKDVFGYSADDYIAVLLIVFWLCSKNPDPLSAPESLYRNKESTILTKENISNFIRYYSCTYKKLRESSLGKQLLYSKPFIQTKQHGKYLSSSMYLVAMLLGNGLYWLIRDYYGKNGGQFFPNEFGLLFEDYIKDLAANYCQPNEWDTLSAGLKKGADFVFDFGQLQMIVEAKTSLLKIDAKQQVPNLASTNIFFNRTIKESYEQLQSSYAQMKSDTEVPIIKIILLYDEFSNTAIIEQSISEIFEQDRHCFIMTIREFEILLYLYCNKREECEKIFDILIKQISCEGDKVNIGAIYENLQIYENPHLKGEMDYFSILLERYKEKLA